MNITNLGIFCGVLLALSSSHAGRAEQAQPRIKSWIHIDACAAERVLVEGEDWEVPVEYYLDPSEYEEGMRLRLYGAGPFIFLPDGVYTHQRGHLGYPGLWVSAEVSPGRRRHVFRLKVPPPLPRNSLGVICWFERPSAERLPWEARRRGVWFKRRGGYFELETDRPGNLFTYDEPVRIMARMKNAGAAGDRHTLSYKVYDTTADVVAQGAVPFRLGQVGQRVPIDLQLDGRGIFLIEAEVPGWEKRETTFGRIPDVMAITKGARTPFGMTNVVAPRASERTEEMCRIARRLGLTSCRIMWEWRELEPGPGIYKLEPWKRALDIGNEHGIDSWLCIYRPPAWAFVGGWQGGSYSAVRVDWDAWRDFVETVTTELKGRLYGWEWLNEITPGGTDDPVSDYVTMCRIGTETAKRVDPGLVTILAGGLWPRSFRIEMLRAGVGKYVDVLPIHYSNGGGVREAKEDLAAVGCEHVAVWDNETAKGVSAWNVPALEQLQDTRQSNWVLTQWTDELAAGCERIIYFGGVGSPVGDFTYIMDDLTPRPVAATLAVLTSKLFDAKPVGVFSLGEGGLFHLFEHDGKPVMVCSSYVEGGEKVALNVGTGSVRVTDHQGNETGVPAAGGQANLDLAPMPYFVEDADLDVLKAYVVPQVQVHRAALKRSRVVLTPRVPLLLGEEGKVWIRLRNLYARELSGKLRMDVPEGWPAPRDVAFSLAPGEERSVPVPLAMPEGAQARDYDAEAVFSFAWDRLPEIRKSLVLAVVSREMVGNLFRNGGFEAADAARSGPEGWRVNGETSLWAGSEGLGLGLGDHVLKYVNSPGYATTNQTMPLRGGQTYLYTAWVWNRNMAAGSNVYLHKTDGSTEDLHNLRVFTAGNDSPYWQMYTCRLQTPVNLETAGFTPHARGDGWALFDNMRLTVFEGTDYVAECYRTATGPRIDGKLDDWIMACPIPLVGRNQLTAEESYVWTPRNLNGVGYMMWDDANLYLAFDVYDDVHHASGTGESVIEGDSLVLAFDPTNRAPDGMGMAFAYHLSSAAPGGGGGSNTMFRPEQHSGGLRSGHLLRDSSLYEMAINRGDGSCVYEIRIPWSELGGIVPGFGAKFAFSVQLNDNDGDGLMAHMNWGLGISPAWSPANFGVVTFID